MMFSKKKELKDPNILAEEIEKNLGTIQDVLQNVRSEKADLHTLAATVENECSNIQAAVKSIGDLRTNIDEIYLGYETLAR